MEEEEESEERGREGRGEARPQIFCPRTAPGLDVKSS